MKNWVIVFLCCYAIFTTLWIFTRDVPRNLTTEDNIVTQDGIADQSNSSATISRVSPKNKGRLTQAQNDASLSHDLETDSSKAVINDENTAHVDDSVVMPDTPREQNLVAEDVSELLAQEQKDAVEYMTHVDLYLQNEETDMAWSDQANNKITNIFASDPLQKSSLLSVDCRSTLCKLEVMHDKNYDQESFEMSMVESFAETLPRGTMIHDPARPNVSVIYMARKGYALPRPRKEEN